MERTKGTPKLSEQLEQKHSRARKQQEIEYDGTSTVVSTGSTLLDLAISGGRFRAGGIPTGILVEIFGPSGTGKTVFLSQIAGIVQRMGGHVMFHDPEARLNVQFARMFGLDVSSVEYTIPDTVTQVFESVRDWIERVWSEHGEDALIGIFADSLTALSTEMEMSDADKMGMRRAKEFSEQLRKTCRLVGHHNVLMVCSNQIRQNVDAGPYGERWKAPGGEAIGFYSSLRLRCRSATKLKRKRKFRGKAHERVEGVKTTIDIYKSSVWKPYREADVYILYDYGIDDIRGNLAFLKTVEGATTYKLGERNLGRAIEQAIAAVESENLEEELRNAVLETWSMLENEFTQQRKPRTW